MVATICELHAPTCTTTVLQVRLHGPRGGVFGGHRLPRDPGDPLHLYKHIIRIIYNDDQFQLKVLRLFSRSTHTYTHICLFKIVTLTHTHTHPRARAHSFPQHFSSHTFFHAQFSQTVLELFHPAPSPLSMLRFPAHYIFCFTFDIFFIYFFHAQHCHTHLSHTSLSHTIFHTQL